VPTELLPAQAELLSLGFLPVGQTEARAGLAKAPMIYNYLAAPSDPRIVACLSFSRNRTIFASYLPDGRMIETGYPPLGLADMKAPKGAGLARRGVELTIHASDERRPEPKTAA
jgi:hypothetical protein